VRGYSRKKYFSRGARRMWEATCSTWMFKRRKKEIYSLISLFVFSQVPLKKGTSANDKRKTGGKYAKLRTKEK